MPTQTTRSLPCRSCSARTAVCVLLFIFISTPIWAGPAASKPNIIFILADDLGIGDPQCYNPASKIPTPHIDQLASEGIRFTDAHSPSSVCSPTRYGILTGRFAWRTGLDRGVLVPYDWPLIEPDRLTVAKMLKQEGYRTGCIGKWHLGMKWALNDGRTGPWARGAVKDEEVDLTKPVTGGPLAAGFDYYFGVDVPNYPPYIFIEGEQLLGPVPDRPKPDNMFGNPGRMQEGWRLERILPMLTRKAVEFIEDRAGSEAPFFLYLPLTAPHTPIVPSKPFQGNSRAGDYGDLVAEVDGTVGAVMAALERLDLAGNTLLIVTSDNGSPARAGDPHIRDADWAATGAVTRLFGHHPSGDYRGMKADVWEGGHRVPFLARWPGKIPAAATSSALICLSDFMATAASILGYRLPENAAGDSFNILPLLLGDAGFRPNRAAVIHHSLNGAFCVRQGRWKLILTLGSGGFSKPRTVDPATLKPGDPRGQLYDLAADPSERHNLWKERQDIVRRLTQQLGDYQRNGRSRPASN